MPGWHVITPSDGGWIKLSVVPLTLTMNGQSVWALSTLFASVKNTDMLALSATGTHIVLSPKQNFG